MRAAGAPPPPPPAARARSPGARTGTRPPPAPGGPRFLLTSKTTLAAQAVPPGAHRILIGSGAAEPGLLVQALMERGADLAGSEVVHLLTMGAAPYCDPAAQ